MPENNYRRPRQFTRGGIAALAMTLGLVVVVDLAAQQAAADLSADTVEMALGPQYRGGWLRRSLWGGRYRDAWTSDIPVPVLDMETEAGGLEPIERISDGETSSLLLRGADGRSYVFRSVDKDPTQGLVDILARSPAGEILRDQVSAEHPLGMLASHELAVAAGVVSPEQRLFVLPDSELLGEFRDEYAGLAGFLSERPGGHSTPDLAFHAFEEVVDGHRIFDRVIASHADVVDSESFLTARLIDLFTGDWDRHRLQWRWGRWPGSQRWVPIPEDPDQAFVRLDGLVPSNAYIFVRQFVSFGPKYPDIVGLHFIAREMDRRFLVDLDWPTWDSVTVATQRALTDEVIDASLATLPAGMLETDGEFLRAALRQRRDGLRAASRRLYELLSEDVEVQFTDLPDSVTIRSLSEGHLEVSASAPGAVSPYYTRRFDPAETDEVRLHLWQGDDRIVALGEPEMEIRVRVVGGAGDDELHFVDPLDRVGFYDHVGAARLENAPAGVEVDRTEYETWVYSEESPNKPVDWGTWIVPNGDLGISSDYGVFVGGGFSRYTYGFRQHPFARKWRVLGGISTNAKLRLEVEAEFRREGTTQHTNIFAGFSQLDVVNFFGFGNDTQRPADTGRQGVERRTVIVEAGRGWEVLPAVDLMFGANLELSRTVAEENPFFSDTLSVYGGNDFGQLGVFASLSYDGRDVPSGPSSGGRFDLRATLYPPAFHVDRTYLRFEGTGSFYLSGPRLPLRPTLALRAGGAVLSNDRIPFFNAGIIGGSRSLRGWDAERFAGESSLFGGAELRLLLTRVSVLSADIGVIGFADAGRVWVDRESPGGWHIGAGGGVWAVVFAPQNTVSALAGFSEEGTRYYFFFGLPF